MTDRPTDQKTIYWTLIGKDNPHKIYLYSILIVDRILVLPHMIRTCGQFKGQIDKHFKL